MLRIGPSLSLPIEAITQTFGILAKRGVGKTYLASVMAEEMLKASLQICVVDPIGVWWGLRAAANGKDPGLPIVVMGGDHGDVPLEAGAGKIIADFVVGERQPVVLDLSLFRKGEQIRFMVDFAETVYHKNRSPLHIFLDEADAFGPQRPMRDEARMLGAMEDIVRRGRARGLGITLVTQRSAVLNKNLLTQLEVLIVLRTIAPQDRDAIDAWINVHGTQKQRDALMDSLPSLPIGTAWFWSPGWLDVFKRVDVRQRETFDSSATPKVGGKIVAPKQLAEVDLEALKNRIASTIEKAKAEDPRELRRRIAELERQVRAQPVQQKEVKVVDQQAIDMAVQAVLREHQRKAAKVQAVLKAVRTELDRQSVKIAAAVDDLNVQEIKRDLEAVQQSARGSILDENRFDRTRFPSSSVHRREASANGVGELALGERRTLITVTQYPDGVNRPQLTTLTGYKRSTRDAYIQRLSQKGYVRVDGGVIKPTEDGIASLGSDYEPLPVGDALRQYWLQRLPEGEKNALLTVIESFPQPIDRNVISEMTGYSRSTRDAYIQRLGAKNLIKATGQGSVRASELLFD